MCIYVLGFKCGYGHGVQILRSLGTLDPLGAGVQLVVSYAVWVLGTKPGSSARATRALNL